ncbi:hypothetical protein CEQ90_13320 [Lewinellaceae bacterium SD302]|nr:hypothetical protein CEQ90_13320 [Lewinellaceae bacterium SD302]
MLKKWFLTVALATIALVTLSGQGFLTYTNSFCGIPGQVTVDLDALDGWSQLQFSDGTVVDYDNYYFEFPAGEYTLQGRVSDDPWQNLITFTIEAIQEVTVIFKATQPTCTADVGSIDLSGTYGDPDDYLFSLVPLGQPHAFSSQFSYQNLAPGTYEGGIRSIYDNSATCTDYATYELVPTGSIEFALDVIPASQCGASDGSITVIPAATNAYEFQLNNGGWTTNSTFSGLANGNYIIRARGQNDPTPNCVTEQSVLVGQAPPDDIPVVLQASSPSACGRSDGSVNIVSQPPGNYLHRINEGGWTSATFFGGLNSGSYTVESREAQQPTDGCYSSRTIQVVGTAPPTIQLVSLEPTVCGFNDGRVNVNPSPPPVNGIAYQYEVETMGTLTQMQDFQFEELRSEQDYTFYVQPTGSSNPACRVSASINLPYSNFLEVEADVTNPTLCTEDNGSITLSDANEEPIWAFLLGSNLTPIGSGMNVTLDDIGEGNFTFEILPAVLALATAPEECYVYISVETTDPGIDEINYNFTSPSACGVADGTVEVTSFVGNPELDYEFSLDDQNWQMETEFSGLLPGNYNLYARPIGVPGNEDCKFTSEALDLSAPPSPEVEEVVENPSACGVPDGSITLNYSGQITLEFRLDDGDYSESNVFADLSAGDYEVSYRPVGSTLESCVRTIEFVLLAPPAPTLSLDSLNPSACGRADGSVTLIATGAGDFEYQLNSGSFTGQVEYEDLIADTYTFSVRPVGSTEAICVASKVAMLEDPPAPELDAIAEDPSACGRADGSVYLEATGAGQFEYAINTEIFGPDHEFEDLMAGTYIFSVRPTNSLDEACTTSETVTLTDPTPPSLTAMPTDPSACGRSDGSVSLSASGQGGFEYNFDGGAFSPQTDYVGLSAGTYTFSVRPTNSLDEACTTSETVTLTNPAAPVLAAISTTPSACGRADGSVNLSASGQGDFEYSFDGGSFSLQTDYADLLAGTYTFSVRPTNSLDEACTTSETVTLTNPAAPVLAAISTTPSACGRADGSVNLSASGQGEFEYSFDGGAFTPQTDYIGLLAGTYTFSVRPTNSLDEACTTSETVTLTNPAAPVLAAISTTPSACGRADGSVNLSASGQGDFEYSFDGGSFSLQTDYADLLAGTYTFSVRPTNSLDEACTTSETVTLTNPAAPVLAAISTDPSACGRADGSVNLSASGQGEFEYSFDGGSFSPQTDYADLAAGTYTFSVRPTNSLDEACTTSETVILTDPAPPSLTTTSTDPSACGRADGSVNLSASGQGEFEYSFDGGAFTPQTDYIGLLAGTYTFSVRPTNSLDEACTASETVILTDPAPPSLTTTSTDPSACGRADGSVSLSASGQGDFEYSFDGGAFTPQTDYIGLLAGTYTFSVRPTNSLDEACVTSETVTLTNPAAPVLAAISTNPSACGRADGSVNLSANGQGDFEYSFEGGAFTPQTDYTGLVAGTYIFSVRPTNSLDAACVTSETVTIADPAAPSLTTTSTDPSACGRADGSVSLSASGQGEFEFSFDGGSFSPQADYAGLAAGTYTLSVRPTNSLDEACTTSETVILTDPAPPSLTTTYTDPSACGRADGSVSLSASGQGDFEYSLDGGAFSPQADYTGLTAGIYTVSVRPTNSLDAACTTTETVMLTDPAAPTLLVSPTNQSGCGLNDGNLQLSATPGDPLEYFVTGFGWSNQTVYPDLPPGGYEIMVRPIGTLTPGLCTDNAFENLQPPPLPELLTSSSDPTSCGASDGTIQLSISEQNLDVEFRLILPSGGSTEWSANGSFDGLEQGAYLGQLRLNGADNCIVESLINLAGVDAPQLTASAQSPTSCGLADGVILAQGPPTGTYEYRLGENGAWQSGAEFSGLSGNAVYIVFIRSNGNNDCLGSTLVTVPAGPLAELTVINELPTDCGAEDGGFTPLVSNGSPQDSYEYRAGILGGPLGDWLPIGAFTNAAPTTYAVELRMNGADHCAVTTTTDLSTIVPPAAQLNTTTEPSFCGSNDGSLSVVVNTNGTYEYALNDPMGNYQPTGDFADLSAGEYVVYIQPVNGYVPACQGSIVVNLEQPAPGDFTVTTEAPSNCGSADASVIMQAIIVGPDYEYQLFNPENGTLQTSENGVFENLTAGSYELELLTSTVAGCSTSQTIDINSEETPPLVVSTQHDPTWCGGQDGQIIIAAPPINANYLFGIDGPDGDLSPNGDFSNLTAGNYELVVVGQSGGAECFTTQSITLSEGTIAGFSLESDSPTGCGSNDGSIQVTSQGGTPNPLFELRDSLSQVIASNSSGFFGNLLAGTYTVSQYTNQESFCAFTETTTLIAVGAPAVIVGTTNEPSQCGLSDGSIQLENLDGGDYQYALSPDGPFVDEPIFTNLPAGNYQVYARRAEADNNDCATVISVSLEAPPTPDITAEAVLNNPFCVQSDAMIVVTPPMDEFQSVEYRLVDPNGNVSDWSNNTNYDGLDPGNYLVEVRFNGSDDCLSLTAVTVESGNGQQASPAVIVDQINEDICGGQVAMLTLAAADAASIYFSLDGGLTYSAQTDYIALPPGSYQLMTAVSASGCGATEPMTIEIESINTITPPEMLVTDSENCSEDDGSIQLTGGADYLEYSIENGDNWQTEATFEDLPTGAYNILVRSQNEACVLPEPLTAEVEQLNEVLIEGVSAASANICSGTGAFIAIQASTSPATLKQYSINNGIDWSEMPLFEEPAPGTYQILVRTVGENGEMLCQTAWPQPITIQEVTPGEPPALELVSEQFPSDCESEDGALVYVATGGEALEYSMDGGENWQSDGNFTGLAAGLYSLSVREPNGDCSFEAVATNWLLAPGQALITDALVSQPTDCGVADGSITLEVENNVGVEFSFDGGMSWQSDPSQENLPPGTYQPQVRALDASCLSSWAESIVLTEPATVELGQVMTTAVSDCGTQDGAIQLTETQPEWEYQLEGTETWSSENEFEALAAGSYFVYTRHADHPGCVDSQLVVVAQEVAFLAIAPELVTATGNDCLNQLPQLAISGGLPNGGDAFYQISGDIQWLAGPLNQELPAGNYDITTARTADGCGSGPTTSVALSSESTLPIEGLTELAPTHCDSTNGLLEVLVAGTGNAPLSYSLNGGQDWQASPVFNGLGAGTYVATIRHDDNETCLSTAEPATLIADNVVSITDVIATQADGCGIAPAIIEVVVEVPLTEVEFSIDGGENWLSQTTFSGLNAGTYSVAVRHVNDPDGDCATFWGPQVVIDSVVLYLPPEISLEGLIVPSGCSQSNGEINLTATGNTDYEFSIDGGENWQLTAQFDELLPGNYELWARPLDEECLFTELFEINLAGNNTPSIASYELTSQSDCGLTDGSLLLNTENATPSSEYSIDGGQNWQGENLFTGLGPDTFQLRMRDTTQSCQFNWQENIVLDTIAVPVLLGEMTFTSPTDCGVDDGSITINFLDNTVGHVFEANGPTFAIEAGGTAAGLAAGSYTVTIMNQNGLCRTELASALLLSEPDTVAIDSVSTTDPSSCGSADGVLRIYPANTDWEYSIDGGESYQPLTQFTELVGGGYVALARSTSYPGCLDELDDLELSGAELLVSEELAADFVVTDNCSMAATASVEIDGVGEGDYLYSLDGGNSWSAELNYTVLPASGDSIYLDVADLDTACLSLNHLVIATEPISSGTAILLDSILAANCQDGAEDGQVWLDGIGEGDLNYVWSDGQTGPEAINLAAGSYSVSLIDAAGCVDSLTVEVDNEFAGEVPSDLYFLMPQQAVLGNTVRLIDATTGNYGPPEWQLDESNTTFVRARDRSIFVTFDVLGFITVGLSVEGPNGCPLLVEKEIEIVATAEELDVDIIDGNALGFLNFLVYPNPTTENVWVEASFSTPQSVNIELRDPNGNLIFSNEGGQIDTDHFFEISLADQPAGAYPLLANSNGVFQYAYLIKQ